MEVLGIDIGRKIAVDLILFIEEAQLFWFAVILYYFLILALNDYFTFL